MRKKTNVGSQVLQVLPMLEQLEPRLLLSADGFLFSSLYEVGASLVSPAWFENLASPSVEVGGTSSFRSEETVEQIDWNGQMIDVRRNEWIVQLTSAALEDLTSVADTISLFVSDILSFEVVRGLGMAGQLLIRAPDTNVDTVANALGQNSNIAYYEPNALLAIDSIPNDTDFSDLWGLNNTGQTGGTADADIDAPEAWNISTGSSGIVVAVIDTGVDYNHPDLAANIWTNPGEIAGNDIDDDGNGFVDDVHGYDFVNNDNDPMDDNFHGTHVAGTIAAVGNNSAGIAGVCWSASIMPVKVWDNLGDGTWADTVSGVNYVTMMRRDESVNIRVINYSGGGIGYYSTSLRQAIESARDEGILFLAAAGNGGPDQIGDDNDSTPHYPSNYPVNNIIAVAATDHNDQLAVFSNYGDVSVDLSAPGVNIMSTFPTHLTAEMIRLGYSTNYETISGTSMATPHVSGVAALAWTVDPSATYQEIRDAILDNVDPVTSLSGKTVTGGRLNAYEALQSLTSGSNHRPVLSDGGVTPLYGDASELYRFKVHYYDEDGDPPTTKEVHVSGGISHELALISGDPADGDYIYNMYISAGNHTHYYWFSDGQDDQTYYCPGPYVDISEGTALSIYTKRWDDPLPDGDNDGTPEPGETVTLRIMLENESGIDAEEIEATLTCNLSNIQITDPNDNYGTIPNGQHQWGNNDYRFFADIPDPVDVVFTLSVTYEQNGTAYYQNFTFDEDFQRAGPEMQPHHVDIVDDSPPDGDGDLVPESGEFVEFDLYIQDLGTTFAKNVRVKITDANAGTIYDAWYDYPDFFGSTPQKQEHGHFHFVGSGIPASFTGWLTADIYIDYDGAAEPVFFDDYQLFWVEPDPWLRLDPLEYDFGVTGTGVSGPDAEDVTLTVTIQNYGSESLEVTGIVPSHGDTTIPTLTGAPLNWTIPAQGSKTFDVEIDTYGLEGLIERVVTVTSTGRLAVEPDDNQIVITGLVSDLAPFYEVPGAAPAEYTDVSGDIIVWAENRGVDFNIYAYNLSEGMEYEICTAPGGQYAVRISGNLIAWEDYRNDDGSGANPDIYAYYFPTGNIAEGQVIEVSTDGAYENLIGVDGGNVAFRRVYYTFVETHAVPDPGNLYLYDVTDGTSTNFTNFTHSGHNPMGSINASLGRYDFGGDLLVWNQLECYWHADHACWESRNGKVMKLQVGAPPPVQVPGITSPSVGPITNDGKIVWNRQDANNRYQVWLWEAGSTTQITTADADHGEDNLALGDSMVVYKKSGVTGLFGYEFTTSIERWVFNQYAMDYSLRMDGHLAVWSSGGRLGYAFLNQADLSVAPGDISFSDDQPTEGDTIDVTVTVHNVNLWDGTGDITVKLYNGDPDDDGIQWGSDEVISGGIPSRSEDSVTFSNLTVLEGWEGTQPIFVKVFISSGDNPVNNKAYRNLDVQDSDTVGPVIDPVVVADYDGDGDGVIGADEQLQISWGLTDPSGIGSVQLWVDFDGNGLGEPGSRDADDAVTLDGDYYAIFGPLDTGEYDYAIDATDADNSPASSAYTGTFVVVSSEEITIRYDGQPLIDGETVPIDFGTAEQSADGIIRVFFIYNDGQQTLSLGALTVPDGFQKTGPASTIVPPGGSTYFTVTLDTSTAGMFDGDVSLANTDGPRSPDGLDENPFNFAITGTVVPIPGDLNGNGYVGGDDLDIILGNWGNSVPPGDLRADADDDGNVDGDDLDYVLADWGKGTAPAGGAMSSESVEPLTIPASSDAIAGNNFLMDTHAPLAMKTFEGDTVAARLTDAFDDETVDLLADVGKSDVDSELVASNELNVDSVAIGDGQASLWAPYASEAGAGDETAYVESALDSILDELDPLEIPDLRQLAAV